MTFIRASILAAIRASLLSKAIGQTPAPPMITQIDPAGRPERRNTIATATSGG
jgi:hypothetical protein